MAYKDVILATSGLVHYYQLNERSGTTLADSKGTQTLTIGGTTALNSPGVLDNNPDGAFDTTGGTTGTATATATTQLAGASDFTYEIWIRGFTNTTSNIFFMGEGSGTNANPLSYIGIKQSAGAGLPRLFVRNAALTSADVSGTVPINDGKRHYLCLTGTISGLNLNLYVDDPVTPVATAPGGYPTGTYGLNQFSIGSLFRTANANNVPAIYGHAAEYNVAISQATRTAHIAAAIKGNPAMFF